MSSTIICNEKELGREIEAATGTLVRENNEKTRVIDNVFTQIGADHDYLNVAANGSPSGHDRKTKQPLVLHIDDDLDLVDAVTMRLKSAGFRVASAADGVAGLQTALAYPADAIILDYDMPNGRGDFVIKQLKKNPHVSKIPIIVLTALHKKSLERQLLSMGADVFMTKPFEFGKLTETIRLLIGGQQDDQASNQEPNVSL